MIGEEAVTGFLVCEEGVNGATLDGDSHVEVKKCKKK